MRTRIAAATLAVVLAACALTGCAPASDPAEPAPLFTSEADAFAAAEETYRAYVDALNQRRDDPAAAADPEEFLTGNALEVNIETQQQLDQAGLAISGPTVIASIEPESASDDLSLISITVCLDSTRTQVINAEGENVTPQERQTRTPVAVSMRAVGTRLLISRSEVSSAESC